MKTSLKKTTLVDNKHPTHKYKQIQTRSTTLNSGRSFTNNKRNSYESTEIKQKSYHNPSLDPSHYHIYTSANGISHKVIHKKNNQQQNIYNQNIDPKCKQPQKYLKLNPKNINDQRSCNNRKASSKNASIQKIDPPPQFLSHRQSIIHQYNNFYNHFNAENKQNIPMNVIFSMQNIQNMKRSLEKFKKNKSSSKKDPNHNNQFRQFENNNLNKLSFVVEKQLKNKKNMNKKRLIIDRYAQGQQTAQKQQTIKNIKMNSKITLSQIPTCSTSKSINQSKKSINSGRSRSTQGKKENYIYLKKKTSVPSAINRLIEAQQMNKKTVKNRDKQNLGIEEQEFGQEPNLMQPVDDNNFKNNMFYQDERNYSIKAILKSLIESSDVNNEKKINKIIECLTTDDNEHHDRGQGSQSDESSHFNHKLYNQNQQEVKSQMHVPAPPSSRSQATTQMSTNNQSFPPQHTLNSQNETLMNQKNLNLINEYEQKIATLYEQLILQKQKRYRLQEIIENYIITKDKQAQTQKSIG